MVTRESLEAELGEELTLDGLTRDFRILQRRRGHRHSVDDLLTAWYAATVSEPPRTMLDLGTGIGSVGLALKWVFPSASLTAIEVQEISFRLLRANVELNRVDVTMLHGDLRELGTGSYDLVTGSPPYFDVKNGVVSADSQRAGARFELRGDVRDYCHAAARNVADDGRFVFCFPTVQRARALSACTASGLHVLSYRDVIPKLGVTPLFTLFACARTQPQASARGHSPVIEQPFVVRDTTGAHTPTMTAARALFGNV